jgi:hypothetical protein
MNAEYNRDEFASGIREAYDRNMPDDYTKNRLFNDIIEKSELNDGRRTIMENMFRVRYICMVGILFILLIILPGGTYTAVKMINDDSVNESSHKGGIDKPESDKPNGDKSDNMNNTKNGTGTTENGVNDNGEYPSEIAKQYDANTPEEYKQILCRLLKGDYDDRFVEGRILGGSVVNVYDERLEAALQGCKMEPKIYMSEDGAKQYCLIGIFGGKGLSDAVFDKNDYRIYAAYVCKTDKEFVDKIGYVSDYPITCTTIQDSDGEVREYGYSVIYDYKVNEHTWYYIIDITAFCINNNDGGVVMPAFDDQQYIIEEYNIPGDTESGAAAWSIENRMLETSPVNIYNYIDEAEKQLTRKKNEQEYNFKAGKKEWEKVSGIKYKDLFSSDKRDIDLGAQSRFEKKYPKTIEAEDVKFTLENKFSSPSELFDKEWHSYDNSDKSDNVSQKFAGAASGRVFCELDGIQVEGGRGKSADKTITITVENATICRTKKVSAEEEKAYESLGYLGSTVNMLKSADSDERYTVYLNCGNSITIPFDKQDTLGSYGIYIDSDWLDLSSYPEYSLDEWYGMYWYDYYLNECVKIQVRVDTEYGFCVQNVATGIAPKVYSSGPVMKRLRGWVVDERIDNTEDDNSEVSKKDNNKAKEKNKYEDALSEQNSDNNYETNYNELTEDTISEKDKKKYEKEQEESEQLLEKAQKEAKKRIEQDKKRKNINYE